MRLSHAFLLLVVLPAVATAQQVRYVDPAGAPGAAGTCDAPFSTLSEALAWGRVSPGDKLVRMAAGTYVETGLVIDFSDLELRGGYPAAGIAGCDDVALEAMRDRVVHATVLDGGGAGRLLSILPNRDLSDPMNPVFLSSNSNIVIDGVTFLEGKPVAPDKNGGAIFALNCTGIVLSNDVFRANQTAGHFALGGAVYLAGYATTNPPGDHAADLHLQDNLFEGNSVGGDGSGSNSSGLGGALAALDDNSVPLTSVTAIDNVFRGNTAWGSGDLDPAVHCPDTDGDGDPDYTGDCDHDGDAEHCHSRGGGGAVALFWASGSWTGNSFEDNAARGRADAEVDSTGVGGALFSFARGATDASPSITQNVFSDNVAAGGLGGRRACGYFNAQGGAVYLLEFDSELEDNTFVGNVANGAAAGNAGQVGWGGSAFVDPSGTGGIGGDPPTISGNLFEGNSARSSQSQLGGWGGGLAVVDLFGNSDPVISNNFFDSNNALGLAAYAGYGGGLTMNTTGNYPVVWGNRFEGNRADGLSGFVSGIGGAAWVAMGTADGVIADNVIEGNLASDILAGSRRLTLAGLVVFGDSAQLGDPFQSPLIMNNLIVRNAGIGLSLMGIPWDPDGSGSASDPDEFAFVGGDIRFNTIAANEGAAVLMNLSDEARFTANIIHDNDRANDGVGNFNDNWISGGRPSRFLSATHNLVDQVETLLADQLNDPANENIIGMSPVFVDEAGGDYHLQHLSEPGQSQSPALDVAGLAALLANYGTPNVPAGRDYDGDGDLDTLHHRSTNAPRGLPDVVTADIGYHYPLAMDYPDTDLDGIPDVIEAETPCLDPLDADVDDDGVPDGLDVGGDLDGDGLAAACDCDADGDGLPDGTELGLVVPVPDDPSGVFTGTDTAATCTFDLAPAGCSLSPLAFWPGDPTQLSDPLVRDSDGGGEIDGCERAVLVLGVTRDVVEPLDDDPDWDGWSSGIEDLLLTDPFDADSDDDGVGDYEESDAAGLDVSEPLLCDTDFDGLPDGLERNLGPVPDPDGPGFPMLGTDLSAICDSTSEASFIENLSGVRTTAAGVRDSDGDGCADGVEDANHDGQVSPGETDPAAVDCSPQLFTSVAVQALRGGSATCGLATVPPLAELLDARGACAELVDPRSYLEDCPGLRLDASEAGWSMSPAPLPLTRPGEALPGSFGGAASTAPLVLYELDDCTDTLRLRKLGADLLLDLE